MQTVKLLMITTGTAVAFDVLPQMVDRTIAEAESACVSDRLETASAGHEGDDLSVV